MPLKLERAQAVNDLLRRAYHGPPGRRRDGGWGTRSGTLGEAGGGSYLPGTGGSPPARVPPIHPVLGSGTPAASASRRPRSPGSARPRTRQ